MDIKLSELPLRQDGSIYHLAIHPEQLADIVLLVGDPGRVPLVSQRFDIIETKGLTEKSLRIQEESKHESPYYLPVWVPIILTL